MKRGIVVAMLLLLAACQQAARRSTAVEPDEAPVRTAQEEVNLGFSVIREAEPIHRVSDLTNVQKDEILAQLHEAKVNLDDVWFGVLVLNRTWRDSGGKSCALVIYLRPTFTGEHFRSGKCLRLNLSEYSGRQFSLESPRVEKWASPLRDYAQVSQPYEEFQDRDEIPPPNNLPFNRNPDLTPAEIIEVVHAVRKLVRWNESIHWIRRIDASDYEVRSSTCTQMMAGRGKFVTIRKENGTWRVIQEGMWLSCPQPSARALMLGRLELFERRCDEGEDGRRDDGGSIVCGGDGIRSARRASREDAR